MKGIAFLFLCWGSWCYGQIADFPQANFPKADSVAMAHKGASLHNLPLLVHQLTDRLPTHVEQFRAIYTWVCTNIENDYHGYLRTSRKRKKHRNNRQAYLEWNNAVTPAVFNKLRSQGKTACSGYAYLIREMALLAHIPCEIVNGYGRTATLQLHTESTPNHAWNAVKLNEKWYLCDATWSAGRVLIDDGTPKFLPDYFDGYFLAHPEVFIKNHYPLDLKWSLLENPPGYASFIDGPVVYKEAFGVQVMPISPIKMHLEIEENQSVNFICLAENPENGKHLSLCLGQQQKPLHTVPTNATHQKNEWTLNHTFTKRGLHDVHIAVNDTLIATYVVKVRRAKR